MLSIVSSTARFTRPLGGAEPVRVAHMMLLLLAITLFALPTNAHAQRLFGLVIGIDDYVGEQNDLKGAVNDADDIQQALKGAGAERVVKLVDSQATKEQITRSWSALVDLAASGDVLVFSFAGHGDQEPEPPGRNTEEDGKNENFLLGGYTPKGPGVSERIVDDEINEWLNDAEAKGIRVVFVADACHSGTMTRSAPLAGVRFRNGNFGDIDFSGDVTELPPPAIAQLSADDFERVTFIGATQENKLTPELLIDGEQRGALSWAFSRAIEGAADQDADGDISQLELLSYLVPTVEQKAESQQTPSVLPIRPQNDVIFRQIAVEPKPAEGDPGPVAKPRIRLFIEGDHFAGADDMPGVEVVNDKARADLIWNRSDGTVEHNIGGRVAEDITDTKIIPVLSKWAAMSFLRSNPIAPVGLTLASGNETYHVGDEVRLQMTDARLPYLTMFNLPPNGRVEFFIPANAAETLKDWRSSTLSERFKVSLPPFGAEHLVAILSTEPLTGLHQALKQMSTAEKAAGLATTLETLLRGQEYQAGIIGIYTSGEPK